jgi:hypothetical protein
MILFGTLLVILCIGFFCWLILTPGKRLRAKVFAELQSHYLFEDRFGRPGKGR